ncbi:MAG: hypothetical protein K2L30_10475, partial [Duncaniella sp.]|nr:hypothetical protein [Duncaniella sp.]
TAPSSPRKSSVSESNFPLIGYLLEDYTNRRNPQGYGGFFITRRHNGSTTRRHITSILSLIGNILCKYDCFIEIFT